eukprot:340164-Hanusia_phi.AAC.1
MAERENTPRRAFPRTLSGGPDSESTPPTGSGPGVTESSSFRSGRLKRRNLEEGRETEGKHCQPVSRCGAASVTRLRASPNGARASETHRGPGAPNRLQSRCALPPGRAGLGNFRGNLGPFQCKNLRPGSGY